MGLCCLMDFNLAVVVLALTVITALYFYLSRKYNYWSSRGINGPKPSLVVGNMIDLFRKPVHQIEDDRRDKFGRIFGTYMGMRPVLTVAEPELIMNIMIKDFNVFVNRQDFKLDDSILDRALTAVKDDDWKNLRSIISPSFSSSKMRKMHHLVEQCVQPVNQILNKAANDGQAVEMKKLMGNYTMDVIATCAFATKTDTHNDPNNLFVKYAIKIFKGNIFRGLLFVVAPKIRKFFNLSVIDPEIMNFFSTAIKQIMHQRNDGKDQYHDFLQLMINAKKKKSESQETNDTLADAESHHGQADETQLAASKTKYEVTDNDILATSLVFFLAGFETTASLLSFLFYSLALSAESQEKLFNEISGHKDEKGNVDYDKLAQLPYLDACVSETLRLYNPAMQTLRLASKDYQLGDTGIVVEKGTLIQIPIHAIHHNPDFYPNPYHFDPERFLPENKHKLTPYTYLPFGAGPRNCVGMRFALMEAKTLIADIVSKYKFVKTEATQVPLKFKKFVGLLQATDITLGVQIRQ